MDAKESKYCYSIIIDAPQPPQQFDPQNEPNSSCQNWRQKIFLFLKEFVFSQHPRRTCLKNVEIEYIGKMI